MNYSFSARIPDRAFPPLDPSPPAIDACRLSIFRDLDALAADWIELETRARGGSFQSFAWCNAWAEATHRVGHPEQARIVTVWSGARLVLLWPLAARWLGPFRILQSFGYPATQYCDALVEQGSEQAQWLELAWNAIRGMDDIDAVRLTGVRDDAVIAPLVASRRHVRITRKDGAPFADLRPSAGALRRRSSRTRNALQRHLRRLSELGATVIEPVEGDPARVRAIRELLVFKHAWIARTAQVSAGYSHPANDTFLEILAQRDDFLVMRLSVDGVTAAVEGGLLRDGRYCSMVQSYDERFAVHGPGRLIFWQMLERAPALQIDVFDFLAPHCPHKAEWASATMPVRDAVVPLRTQGWAVVAFIQYLRPLLKRCATALSSWLRRRATRPISAGTA